jgi:dTDP-4-dehydrorhamnose reductase
LMKTRQSFPARIATTLASPLFRNISTDMRIAVTGSQGQVARSILERAKERGVDVVTLARPQFDLAEPSTINASLTAAKADLVVNAAAYTAVDKAESEEALAREINCTGAAMVADVANRLAIPVIHLSTDYVFDGSGDLPFREDDPTGPLNAYGRSKLAGENAVKAANARHIILRTSWVYSPFGANFVRTMLRLGETRAAVSVVADQIGQPTCALDIADAILDICDALKTRSESDHHFGLFHLAGSGGTNWAEFAEAIFAEAARHGRPSVSVTPIATSQYPTPARRPANSRLDTQKLANVYGIELPQWRNSLSLVIERLLQHN